MYRNQHAISKLIFFVYECDPFRGVFFFAYNQTKGFNHLSSVAKRNVLKSKKKPRDQLKIDLLSLLKYNIINKYVLIFEKVQNA